VTYRPDIRGTRRGISACGEEEEEEEEEEEMVMRIGKLGTPESSGTESTLDCFLN